MIGKKKVDKNAKMSLPEEREYYIAYFDILGYKDFLHMHLKNRFRIQFR